MKIGIDISQIVYGTGVSVYTKSLVRELLTLDPDNQYYLFGGSLRQRNFLKSFIQNLPNNPQAIISPISPTLADFIWNRLHVLPIESLLGKLDVFHASDWTQPPTRAFSVTTVHDLAPLRYEKLTNPKIVAVHKRRLHWVIKEADRIIVPSIATRNEMLYFGAKEERLRVIPEAAEALFFPRSQDEITKIRQEYQISGKYIITVGIGPRKNTKLLMEAFEKVRGHVDIMLLFVGRGKIDHIPHGIKQLGFVSDENLACLYSGAEALVYPALYEGFGLPIVQAMACGCPVVTSKVSSMAEVAGNAGILVDPNDTISIEEGIKTALRRKTSMSAAGRKRASEFSWRKTAEATLSVYNESRKK